AAVGATVAVAGTWYHVAAVKSGLNISLYVNGALDGSGTLSAPVDSNTAHLFAGANPSGASFFDGLIDEVELFNRALSAGEILGIFQADTAGKCTGPITFVAAGPIADSGPPVSIATVA